MRVVADCSVAGRGWHPEHRGQFGPGSKGRDGSMGESQGAVAPPAPTRARKPISEQREPSNHATTYGRIKILNRKPVLVTGDWQLVTA